jgi:hypothetical protein
LRAIKLALKAGSMAAVVVVRALRTQLQLAAMVPLESLLSSYSHNGEGKRDRFGGDGLDARRKRV